MTAKDFYINAQKQGLELECTCVDISTDKWDELMKNAKKACKRQVAKLLGIPANEERMNPYSHYRTETHVIYVHSCIEHFYRINN